MTINIRKKVKEVNSEVEEYLSFNQYKGWDPFDGLNSKVFKNSPLNRSKLSRLIWVQLFKRSPFNFRDLLKVPKDSNPQGLALQIMGYIELYKIEQKDKYLDAVAFLCQKLLDSRSAGFSGSCWGYNFDWQARAFYQPKGTPLIVPTSFAISALCRSFEIIQDQKYKEAILSSKEFVLHDLNKTYDEENETFSFSYSPVDHSVVFNASLLASRVLLNVYNFSEEQSLLDEAKKAIRFVIQHQNQNGSWCYGLQDFHSWIDNFHTGYNIDCIHKYGEVSGQYDFTQPLQKAMDFYLNTFFTAKGVPKYYHNKLFPVDLNNTAQLILTTSRYGNLNENINLVERVVDWSIDHMFSKKRGYFYYQKNRVFKNKIPYIRWTQSWMFFSLSTLLNYYEAEGKEG